MEQIGVFVIASTKTLDTFIPHQDNILRNTTGCLTLLYITDVWTCKTFLYHSRPGQKYIHRNDTQRSCICLNIEATVNVRSWSCAIFSRCAMNVTGVVVLEITKISNLHAHDIIVHWKPYRMFTEIFNLNWCSSLYSWSLRASMNCWYTHILHGQNT